MRILPSVALFTLFLNAELPAAGELDTNFNPDANGEIKAMALAPDGKIIVGGSFSAIGGEKRSGIARLQTGGKVDTGWVPPSGAAVPSCVVLGDGSVIAGADVGTKNGISRLLSSGLVDDTYQTRVSGGEIRAMNVGADGSLLLGGNFTAVNNLPRRGFAVVGTEGLQTLTVDPGEGKSVNSLFRRPDKTLFFGGDFTMLSGALRVNVGKFGTQTVLDSGFKSPVALGATASVVNCVAMQTRYDSFWVLVGGNFPATTGDYRSLIRMSVYGVRDTFFNPIFKTANLSPATVTSVAVQADGYIIVAGNFARVNDVPAAGLVRLDPWGAVDSSFSASASGVTQVALQADGKVLISGTFQQVNGVPRNRIARLNNSSSRETLSILRDRIVWSRLPSAPTSELVSFELSKDGGTTWEMLKTPSSPGNSTWTLTGLNLPSSGIVRARARVTSGGSSGLVENRASYQLAPEITVSEPVQTWWTALTDGQTTPVDFGVVLQGQSPTKEFLIRNTGNLDLTITGVTLPPGFALSGTPTLPLTVVPGNQIKVPIRVDGTQLGSFSGTVIIESNDADEASFEFPLAATVVGPEIAMHLGDAELLNERTEPISFAQGYQGTQQLRETVVISNQGTGDLQVSSISVGAGFTVDKPQPFSLQPGESRLIQVGPDQSVAGALTGNLEVYSDDLDEPVFRVPLAATVLNPLVTQVLNTKTTLDRKSGAREQKLRITNTTKVAAVGGFRVIVRGLPEGVVVRNASEVLPDGSVVIEVNQPLPPKGKYVLVLEYEIPKGSPVVVYPQLTTEVILNTASTPKALALSVPDPAAPALAVEKCERTIEGDFALTFRTVPGRLYQVEYSANGTEWKACAPTRADGGTVRWVDSGSPQTECSPKDAPRRIYRVRELE